MRKFQELAKQTSWRGRLGWDAACRVILCVIMLLLVCDPTVPRSLIVTTLSSSLLGPLLGWPPRGLFKNEPSLPPFASRSFWGFDSVPLQG